ncbi:hypothetical protein QYF36_017857 [Acer negundo]|nr:hypothetical protein QYF36_017857 [Acer negundo]
MNEDDKTRVAIAFENNKIQKRICSTCWLFMAWAVKRFVKENQWLAEECRRLLSECSLYEHGREALMEYRGEADERAKEAEIRVHNLEVQSGQVLDDLNFYKHQNQTLGDGVDPYEEHQQDRNLNGSGGKHTSNASAKVRKEEQTNKLKSSPRMSSPIEKKIDFDLDPAIREPLSPLQYNSSDSRMHKK